MITLAAASLLLAHPLIAAPTKVKLDAFFGESPYGFAEVDQRILPDGTKHIQMTMQLQPPEAEFVRVRTESLFDPDGKPLRKIFETSRAGGKDRRMFIATFEPGKAMLAKSGVTDASSVEVTIEKNLNIANSAEFWFVKAPPAEGAKSSFYNFLPAEGAWRLTIMEYLGPGEATFMKKVYKGHRIRTTYSGTKAETLVDNQGLPILMEAGAIKFVRKAD